LEISLPLRVADPRSGAAPLGFQVHGVVEMKCEYRNIKIAEL